MKKRKKSYVPPDERVPVRDKLILGGSGLNSFIVNNIVTGVLWMPVFNIGFGINAAVLGIVAMIFKAWDAFLNPFVGNLSDNTRTRWGRRRPYIVAGGIATAVLLPLVWWMPEDLGTNWMVAGLIIFGLLLYSAYTVWNIPFEALTMELTPNYDERTNIMAYIAFFGKVIGLLGGWTLAFVTSSLFAGPDGEPDIIAGVRVASIIFAVVFLVAGVAPGIFIKERNYEKLIVSQDREPFLQSMRETASIGPLWFLIGMIFMNLLGIVSISGLGYYINIYFVNAGDIAGASWIEGWRNTAMFAVGILSIPFWRWFSQLFDKKVAMYFILSMTICGHLLNYWCLNPDLPYLLIIPSVLYSGVGSAIWMISPSMKMDVADYDELKTGRRREGSINAVFSFTLTLAVTLSTGLGGIVLELTGFDESIKRQAPEVLDRMFHTYLFLPVVFWLVSILFLWLYKLNRKEVDDIKNELREQRLRQGKPPVT
jgi:GPH family glycoside/pentoside/hexuronide:cation symporter